MGHKIDVASRYLDASANDLVQVVLKRLLGERDVTGVRLGVVSSSSNIEHTSRGKNCGCGNPPPSLLLEGPFWASTVSSREGDHNRWDHRAARRIVTATTKRGSLARQTLDTVNDFNGMRHHANRRLANANKHQNTPHSNVNEARL